MAPSPLTHVGPATRDDLAHLAPLHATAFAHGWSETEFDSLLAPDNVTALVLRPEGGGRAPPTGFVVVRGVADEAEIITLAVRPQARRKGYGEALMRGAILHLRAAGVTRLLLEVDEGNAAAVALYRKLGFREVGRRRAYYTAAAAASSDGKAVPADALVMARPLI